MSELTNPHVPTRTSLVVRLADQWGVEPAKLTETLKATAFKTDKAISNEQLMALLIVAEQYHLNPFTKELFAFADQRGGIVPFISVDGWARIINEHPQYDGSTFIFDREEGSMTCVMHRKDRAHPTQITEYLSECKRNTQPWTSHPRRMLRHKALIQTARIAFGFAGIYDEDEAEAIRDGRTEVLERVDQPRNATRERVTRFIADSNKHFAPVVEKAEPVPTIPEAFEAGPSPLQTLVADLNSAAGNRDEAEQILDYARSVLTTDEYATLAASFASMFTTEETKE